MDDDIEVDIAIENDGEHNEAMKFLMKALKDFKRRNLLRNHGLRLDIYSGAKTIPDKVVDMLRYLRIFDAGLTTLQIILGNTCGICKSWFYVKMN